MTIKQRDDVIGKSPVEIAIDTISGKWKAMILIHLMTEMHRFNELKKMLPNISQLMLANH